MTNLFGRKKWLGNLVVLIGASTAILLGAWIVLGPVSWACYDAESGSEIFQGVTYGCLQLKPTEEGSGLYEACQVGSREGHFGALRSW